MPHRALLLMLAITLGACDPPTKPTKPTKKTPTPNAPLALPTPPQVQAATPAALVARKLPADSSVGKERRGEATRTIQAVGLGQCYDGWALTPMIRAENNKLAPTPPIFVPYRQLAGGAPLEVYTLGDPSARGTMTLTRMDAKKLTATIKLPQVTYELDGAPRALVSGPGLGGRGCFTNGHHRVKLEGRELHGPVTARLEAGHFYRIHLLLSSDHALTVLFSQPPQMRREGKAASVDLAEVFKNPGDHKMRAFFETRVDPGPGAANLTTSDWDQTPVERGSLTLAFEKARDEGPITLVLEKVPWPKGFAGVTREATISRIEATVTPVTDVTGVRVPFAKPPGWWKP